MIADGPWSGGLSYRSGTSVDIDGSFRAPIPGSPNFPTRNTLGAKTTLELPAVAQLGVRFAFSKQLAAEFDVERTYWSTFDNLHIQAKTSAPGATLVKSVNDWNDVYAYRIGITWDMSDRTQMRFGYAIDKTPQEDKHFTARIPDADRQLFSFGVKQDVGDRWEWEGGVMYVLWDDRKINSSTPYTSPAQDPNGTSAFNGKYESDAWLIGFGVGKKF